MKRFLTLSTSLLIVLVGCGATSANAVYETGNATAVVLDNYTVTQTEETLFGERNIGLVELMAQAAERRQAKLEKQKLEQIRHRLEVELNVKALREMVAKTKKYVGVTWYAFSGSTPSGWDCSGLVRWAYSQVGVDLYHSASVQKNAGEFVKDPKLGDIVAFGWRGYRGAQHVGIYIGDGKMLHSGGRRGDQTEITSIADWAEGSGNSLVTYTRILDN